MFLLSIFYSKQRSVRGYFPHVAIQVIIRYYHFNDDDYHDIDLVSHTVWHLSPYSVFDIFDTGTVRREGRGLGEYLISDFPVYCCITLYEYV